MSSHETIVVVRFGAMGDIIHALPAVTSLKRSFPQKRLIWVVARKWKELLEGNPYVDELLTFDRDGVSALAESWKRLRLIKPEIAIDFQGLLQSAIAGRITGPKRYLGLDKSIARESFATWFYSECVAATGPHRVERNLQLAAAAGATQLTKDAWLPPGHPEGELPSGPFVLANTFAGWASKQWPLSSYEELARCLSRQGLALVANVAPGRVGELAHLSHLKVHASEIPGLIHATRAAIAIVGVDSGPLHLAGALGKPGVALFGPTDPAQTGPFNSCMTVLRAAGSETTYKRDERIHASMRRITPAEVAEALSRSLTNANTAAVRSL